MIKKFNNNTLLVCFKIKLHQTVELNIIVKK